VRLTRDLIVFVSRARAVGLAYELLAALLFLEEGAMFWTIPVMRKSLGRARHEHE